jgi:hypothetical protein
MGSKRHRGASSGRPPDQNRLPRSPASATRLWQMAALAAVVAVGIALLVRSRVSPGEGPATGGLSFTRVGRNGPVFTVSVPQNRVSDDQYLLRVAEQLSSDEVQAGGSGQISVMIWPDGARVPKEPPATEFDASMKTQAAGIFVNPKRSIKHMIRFKDGATVSEREFGNPPK